MSSRSGELAMRPLPAVLLDLHDDMATGKLVLRRGRVAKSVDLINGNPVSTASTPRDETLGHFLVNSGVITEDQHRFAVARAAEIGGKLGEALVALQILTVEQLIDQLGKQARHKLVAALRWPQGAWRFDESFEPVEGMQLRMVEVVLGGLRETAIEAPERLARLDAMTFELTARGERLRHELRKTFGEALVGALAHQVPMLELERAEGDRARARMAVDAMLLCDAVTSVVAPVGLGSPAVPRAPTRPKLGDDLYEMLFDDDVAPKEEEGVAPIDFDDLTNTRNPIMGGSAAPVAVPVDIDSGVVAKASLEASHDEVAAARQAIAAEHQRVRGADHYAVLLIAQRATAGDVADAYAARAAWLDGQAEKVSTNRALHRVDELRVAYKAARDVLGDTASRAAYDRELAGGELYSVPPAIDTELGFRIAEELMVRRQWDQAIGHLKTVILRSPNEADYHAALGWAEWNAHGAHAAAADGARQHLNHALSIDPDHAAAHDYKGRIDAALDADDAEAIFHLDRALDLDPSRAHALATIEALLIGKGELRRLERVLKRQLFRLRGKGGPLEALAWARLARLYLDHLDDAAAGVQAAQHAAKLAPKHAEVAALVDRVERARADAQSARRAGWREALEDATAGAELVRSTAASGHVDAAFLAASTMVALGTADPSMADLYEQHRARELVVPIAPLDRDQWGLLRHRDDSVEVGALFELVAPAVHALAPMTLAEGGVEDGARLPEGALPPAFAKLRAAFATVLGVTPAPVFPRVELGMQIHVVACDPPVMVAGDDALTSPERPDLAFRIIRALTFLWPGRAVGASRPGRVLRAVLLAVLREATGGELGKDELLAPRAAAAVAALPEPVRVAARAAALRLLSRGSAEVNLSTWSRSLARTADRAGMLLCSDVPAAFNGARDAGDLDKDLVEFAYSAAHVNLRRRLGVSARAAAAAVGS
jgi:tetratricopeptide (TPR) repeat protein